MRVKLGMAEERGTLDLSECDLLEVPEGAFNIPNLQVTVRDDLDQCTSQHTRP